MNRSQRLGTAIVLNIILLGGEASAGLIAHSLALFADAGHNLTDAAGLIVSLIAVRLTLKPPTKTHSFGLHRSTILAALANAALILVVGTWIVYEAILRILHPSSIDPKIMIIVGAGALAINTVSTVMLWEKSHNTRKAQQAGQEQKYLNHKKYDLNMRTATLHMAGDAASSLGVIIAGGIIWLKGGWYFVDPAVSMAIAVIIGIQAWILLRSSTQILLESTPQGLDLAVLEKTIANVQGVQDVHDVHVWSLTTELPIMAGHIVLKQHPTLEEAQKISDSVKKVILDKFGINHCTIETECERCVDDQVQPCSI
jgi:cobalt-zinc-cadmium efflux system protein